jgi:tetratricopeptide (TPR) repeat protein
MVRLWVAVCFVLLSFGPAQAAQPTSEEIISVSKMLADARALEAKGRRADALAIALKLEPAIGAMFGDVSRQHSDILAWLSGLYRDQSRMTEAEAALWRAVAIDEQIPGVGQKDLGHSLGSLGELYSEEFRLAEAEPPLNRALAIAETDRTAGEAAIGSRLLDLGRLYLLEGRLTEARPLLERALALTEKSGGKHDTAVVVSNLGLLHLSTRDFAAAEPLLLRALALDTATLSADDPGLASDWGNLGHLYREEGRFAEAEPCDRPPRAHGQSGPGDGAQQSRRCALGRGQARRR